MTRCMSLERVDAGTESHLPDKVTPAADKGGVLGGSADSPLPDIPFCTRMTVPMSQSSVRTRLPHMHDGIMLVKTGKLYWSLLLSHIAPQPPMRSR